MYTDVVYNTIINPKTAFQEYGRLLFVKWTLMLMG